MNLSGLYVCLCVHIYALSKKLFLINQRGGTISRPEIAYDCLNVLKLRIRERRVAYIGTAKLAQQLDC